MRLLLLLDPALIPDKNQYLHADDQSKFEIWQPVCSIDEFWKAVAPDLDEIDESCDALLDIGDVEFIEWFRCDGLLRWVEDRLGRPCVPFMHAFYSKLGEYAARAQELHTGVEVEL